MVNRKESFKKDSHNEMEPYSEAAFIPGTAIYLVV